MGTHKFEGTHVCVRPCLCGVGIHMCAGHTVVKGHTCVFVGKQMCVRIQMSARRHMRVGTHIFEGTHMCVCGCTCLCKAYTFVGTDLCVGRRWCICLGNHMRVEIQDSFLNCAGQLCRRDKQRAPKRQGRVRTETEVKVDT